MIEIKPCKDTSGEISELLGDVKNKFVLAVKDGKKILGAGMVELFYDYAVFDKIAFFDQSERLALEFGLGKAMLNFVERREIYHVICGDKRIENLLMRLRFEFREKYDISDKISFENIYYVNLKNYFEIHC